MWFTPSLIPTFFRGPKFGVPVIRQYFYMYCGAPYYWSDINVLARTETSLSSRSVMAIKKLTSFVSSNFWTWTRFVPTKPMRLSQSLSSLNILWTFSVNPRWSESTDPEFVDVGEVLDWALQLIAVVFLTALFSDGTPQVLCCPYQYSKGRLYLILLWRQHTVSRLSIVRSIQISGPNSYSCTLWRAC